MLNLCLPLALSVPAEATGVSFCGHSSSYNHDDSGHFRPRRSVPMRRLQVDESNPLSRSLQTRFGTDSNNSPNNYNNDDKPVIDNSGGEAPDIANNDCNRRRRNSPVRARRQKANGFGATKPFDDCGPQQAHRNSLQSSPNTTTTSEPVKTIETAVFIDQALNNRFNGLSGGLVELNKLVLTIMNQVQHLFRYSSLHVPIKIKLVLIEHLRESDRNGFGMPDTGNGDIDVYLSNFCNWQQARLEKDRQKLAWDHAILLSG